MRFRGKMLGWVAAIMAAWVLTVGPASAAINETVSVTARGKDDPQHNAGDIEGRFQNAPNANQDEIDVTNQNVTGKAAGVYNDPVHDGALLTITQQSGPVKTSVEGRQGIGAMYWVTVTPTGGGGGGGTGGTGGDPTLWADVQDITTAGALVLKDSNGGKGKSDATNSDSDTPTLYCQTASDDHLGDVEFWIAATTGTYNWSITQDGESIATGTLTASTYRSQRSNLPPGSYSLVVTQSGSSQLRRRVDFCIISARLATVAFTGPGLDGRPMYDYFEDVNGDNAKQTWEPLGATPIEAPEYEADTGRSKYALFTIKTQFRVQANFEIAAGSAPGPVVVWAECSEPGWNLGSEQAPVSLSNSSGQTWSGVFQVATAPTAIANKTATWSWHVKVGQSPCYDDSSQHTILVNWDGSDDEGGTAIAAAGRQVGPMAAPPTQETPAQATVAAWATKNAANKTKGEILTALIARTALEDLGCKYEFPTNATGPGQTPMDKLLANKKGSCQDWAETFEHAIKVVHGLEKIRRNAGICRDTYAKQGEQWGELDQYARAFRTKELAAIGTAAQIWTFGDHEWCEYPRPTRDGKVVYQVYDPSFGLTFVKNSPTVWFDYHIGADGLGAVNYACYKQNQPGPWTVYGGNPLFDWTEHDWYVFAGNQAVTHVWEYKDEKTPRPDGQGNGVATIYPITADPNPPQPPAP